MAKNLLVISVDLRETRVALIEDGIIAELHIERGGSKSSTVGNVYLGKVTRVLPGLQAAFIDIGQERAAFLHVEDLIRPNDFEAYLAGGRKSAHTEAGGGSATAADEGDVEGDDEPVLGAVPIPEALASSLSLPDAPSSVVDVPVPASSRVLVTGEGSAPEEVDEELEEARADAEARGDVESDEVPDSNDDEVDEEVEEAEEAEESDDDSGDDVADGDVPDSDEEADDDEGEDDEEADAVPPLDGSGDLAGTEGASEADSADSDRDPKSDDNNDGVDNEEDDEDDAVVAKTDDELFDLPGFTVSEPGQPVPRAPAPSRDREGGGGRGRGRRRGRGRDGGGGAREGGGGGGRGAREGGGGRSSGREGREGGRDARRSSGDRGGRRSGQATGVMQNRISKSTPIREVVQEGQEIIVQVSKDPIGTKGARCTSHVSLPGRYVVYLPTVDHIGISKRIGSDKERARLRETIEGMKPPSGGLIVRTLAEGLTKKQLKQDVGYLVRLWGEVAKKKEGARAPALLSSELDIVLKVARDLFTDEVDQVVIDDRHQYERLIRFVEMFAPDRVKDVELYTGKEPLFDAYGIEDEIQRALSRKVPLPSGGYLIIDQAEALTAIDVNTGRFVGKGSKDMEETILKTNLEAVNEIAYQLRFRNIGGLIILDLIDMEKSSSREKVRRTLDDLLQKDKAKTTLNRISDLGLIEMTRKRTRESLGRFLHEPCFYCDGTGQLQSKETIAFEILREIRRKHKDLPGYTIQVSAHPAVVDLLSGPEKATIADAENRYLRKIAIVPRKDYHLEQFDISGR
jgi:ribonuclease G